MRNLCGCGGAEMRRSCGGGACRCRGIARAEVQQCGGHAELVEGPHVRRSCGGGAYADAEVRSLCGCGDAEVQKLLRRRRYSACRCVVHADVRWCGACAELAEGPHMRRLCTCGACADAEVRSLCGCGGAEVSRLREENNVRGMDLGFCDEVECTVGVLTSLEFV